MYKNTKRNIFYNTYFNVNLTRKYNLYYYFYVAYDLTVYTIFYFNRLSSNIFLFLILEKNVQTKVAEF